MIGFDIKGSDLDKLFEDQICEGSIKGERGAKNEKADNAIDNNYSIQLCICFYRMY